jgi:DNA-binding NarL/FixJ family response regulator
MSEKKKRVVIIDDHPLLRERLAQLINHELDMEVCGEAENAQNGIQLIRNTCADLAIVDIALKGSSGLELIKSVKALSIGTPVLVLSMHDEAFYAERALRAGATGYITKHQAADQIIQAIRRVLAGEVYLSERMTTSFLKNLTSAGVKSLSRPVDRLTDRELEVLELIGSGHTTREIAETLKLGVATVDTYRARIKEKMNFQKGTELQHYAIRWIRERELAHQIMP